jgi:hypothetical protein
MEIKFELFQLHCNCHFGKHCDLSDEYLDYADCAESICPFIEKRSLKIESSEKPVKK